MDKKYLYILIIVIIALIAIVGIFMMGSDNNKTEISDSSNWEVKELAGVEFKVPEKYKSGITMTGSVIDGKETGNFYESNGLRINVFLKDENSTDWDNELNSYMDSSSTVDLLDISGNEVKVVHNDTNGTTISIAFFEVNGDKIAITWEGNIDGDIKAIISSFYELNK